MDRHLEYKNTLASNLITSIKANVFQMRARKHDSSLAASLFDHNVPVEVFHNLIRHLQAPPAGLAPVLRDPAQGAGPARNLPTTTCGRRWRRNSREADLRAGRGHDRRGTGAAGSRLHRDTSAGAASQQRWVDSAPNKGKMNGAFSYGAPGTHPFIMMSFTGRCRQPEHAGARAGSLACIRTSPGSTSRWSTPTTRCSWPRWPPTSIRPWCAAICWRPRKDAAFQIALIEEAMSNFFRYFFQMPTLARFELETTSASRRARP